MSLLAAVTISGLAGVLLEFSFKREGESLWVKNFFLSVFSIPSAFYAATMDVKNVEGRTLIGNLADGFDLVVWMVVLLLALGGLLTALVMKHAGALTKCYAVSVSIVICTVISSVSGIQRLTAQVCLGSTLVICSVFLYASESRSREISLKKHNLRSNEEEEVGRHNGDA
jgi:UDP-sugar transporter A1/2/3